MQRGFVEMQNLESAFFSLPTLFGIAISFETSLRNMQNRVLHSGSVPNGVWNGEKKDTKGIRAKMH
ncbi:hypothetical protein BH10BAC5_BH10BAC5_07520 [soil metagenome]